MFDRNDEIPMRVDAVYRLLDDLDRGDILAHEAIAEVVGLVPHQGLWSYVVHKALRRLQDERGIAYWPVYGQGYKLLTKDEQIALPIWRLERAQRQVRRGRKSLMALGESELTNNQRRARALTIGGLYEIERSQRKDIKLYKMISKPSLA